MLTEQDPYGIEDKLDFYTKNQNTTIYKFLTIFIENAY